MKIQEKCKCNMSHDMAFCTNQNCNTIRKCMRYAGNHIMMSKYNSFSDFGNFKYDENCRYYIKEVKK